MADASLLKQLRELDFSLVEVNLYLDTHPDCPDGAATFDRLLALREEAARQYEESGGLLTAFTPIGENGHRWVDRPWPWEKEAN